MYQAQQSAETKFFKVVSVTQFIRYDERRADEPGFCAAKITGIIGKPNRHSRRLHFWGLLRRGNGPIRRTGENVWMPQREVRHPWADCPVELLLQPGSEWSQFACANRAAGWDQMRHPLARQHVVFTAANTINPRRKFFIVCQWNHTREVTVVFDFTKAMSPAVGAITVAIQKLL